MTIRRILMSLLSISNRPSGTFQTDVLCIQNIPICPICPNVLATTYLAILSEPFPSPMAVIQVLTKCYRDNR